MPSKRFSPDNSAGKLRKLIRAGTTLVAVAGLCFAVPALAQTEPGQGDFLPDYPDVAAERQRESGPGFADVTLKLTFVLLLFGGAAVLYRKYGKPVPTFGGEEVIRLWANRSLGLGSEMYLIEVGDRMLLVGKSGSGMATLSEFTDQAVIAELKSHCVGPMTLPGGTTIWDRLLRREGGR
jgi:flagellar biogenesis protein FliO